MTPGIGPCLFPARQGRAGGTSEGHRGSFDGDRFSLGLCGHTAERILTAVGKDESDGIHEALAGLVSCAALTVCAGDLGAVGDEPVAV